MQAQDTGPEGHERSLTQKLGLPLGLPLIPVGDGWYHPHWLVHRFFCSWVKQTTGPIIVWSGTPGVCRGRSPRRMPASSRCR